MHHPLHSASPGSGNSSYDNTDQQNATESPDPPIIVVVVCDAGIADEGVLRVDTICVVVAAVGGTKIRKASSVHGSFYKLGSG